MSLKLITANENLAIDLTEIKNHLYIVGTADDTELTNKIKEVASLCESFTNRSFLNATYEFALSGFPTENYIYIPKPPLVSVSKVEYYDVSGELQEMNLADFFVDTRGDIGRLVLRAGKSYPATESGHPYPVIITFVAGYGNTHASIPQDLKNAIKLLVGSAWENRQNDFVIQGVGVKALPNGAWFTLWAYKWNKF